jgi:hypothetical protein
MDTYIQNYQSYNKNIIYDFNIGNGGIGDCIKFFMYLLHICIKNNYKLFYKINNIYIEKYIRLKYKHMYFNMTTTNHLRRIYEINDLLNNVKEHCYYSITPDVFYSIFKYNDITMNIEDVFEFSDEVKLNANTLQLPTTYISIHIRLGDKFLETDQEFVFCKDDVRNLSEEKIFKCIEENSSVVLFSDNNAYKQKLKNIYPNIIITNYNIGHTSLYNTTDKQVLDTITEFYIMTLSEKIYTNCNSGFSKIASKFKHIPCIELL